MLNNKWNKDFITLPILVESTGKGRLQKQISRKTLPSLAQKSNVNTSDVTISEIQTNKLKSDLKYVVKVKISSVLYF